MKKLEGADRSLSFLESAWRTNGGLKGFIYFPLTVFSWIYGLLCRFRIFLYAQRLLSKKQAPCPVISIGNLTAGGTGKTPVTIYLAKQWQKKGLSVGIVSRGYQRHKKEPVVLVSDGAGPLESPADIGDEPYLMAKHLKGVPIVVAANRHSGCKRITSDFKVDVILLDDGFQHLKLHRNLNILLIDASRPFGNGHLLPRGPLREPLSEIRRADLVIFTRVNKQSDLKETIRQIMPYDKPLLFSHFEVTSLTQISTGKTVCASDLTGRSILPFCGIGNPDAFFEQLTELGAKIKDVVVFGDHHNYHKADFIKIRQCAESSGAEWIVTTEKDAVKLECLPFGALDYWVLQIDLVPEEKSHIWEEALFKKAVSIQERVQE